MTDLEVGLLKWADTVGRKLALLAEATGSVEGWLRAEAIIAAKEEKFGQVQDVEGEVRRDDLTLTTPGGTARIEFKVAWNNKNLFGGYNGTRGIQEDISKLRNCHFNERLVVVFLGFFDIRECKDLPDSYCHESRKGRSRLQPVGGEDFRDFASGLAATVTRWVTDDPEPVVEIFTDKGRWFGVWVHRVT